MIVPSDPASWIDRVRRTLHGYDDRLLRQVASKLIRPRSQWPAEELVNRCALALDNAALVDRRLAELGEAERRLLACIGHSGQSEWKLSSLLEILATFGSHEGPQQIFRLFESGLVYP